MTIVESLGRAFLTMLAVFVFIIAAVYILLSSVDQQIIKNLVLKELNELSGKTIQVDGAFDLRLWPIAQARMENVSLALNPNYKLDAKMLELDLDPWMLFKAWSKLVKNQDIEIEKFIIHDLKIKQLKKSERHYHADQISGSVSGLNTKEILLDEFKIKSGQSDLQGNLIINLNKAIKITGKTKSQYFDMNDFKQNKSLKSSDKKSNSFFSQEPSSAPVVFELSESPDLMIDLIFQFETLKLSPVLLKNTHLNLKTRDTNTMISSLRATLAEGLVKAEIITSRGTEGGSKMNLQADNIILADFVNEIMVAKGKKKTPLSGGKLSVKLNLMNPSIKEANTKKIIENMKGDAFVLINKAQLEDKSVQTSLSEIIVQIFHVFNPFIDKQKSTQIECAALRLHFKDGVAYAINNFGLETKTFNVWGSGKINLQSEALDFKFYNKPKSGVQLGLEKFAKYGHLKGTLSDPKVSISMQGAVEGGASLLLGMATGGVSTVAEQALSLSTKNKSACASVIQNTGDQNINKKN